MRRVDTGGSIGCSLHRRFVLLDALLRIASLLRATPPPSNRSTSLRNRSMAIASTYRAYRHFLIGVHTRQGETISIMPKVQLRAVFCSLYA